jgi:PAS domain S-box-containing protein
MGNSNGRASENERLLVANNVWRESERLLTAFAHTSAIGFAILDRELRYQAINSRLAKINGMAAEAHLGRRVGEIFGESSESVAEASYRQVFNQGPCSHFELGNVVLRGRAESLYCGVNTTFPIKNRAGEIEQMGILVVDVTEQRKLERFMVEFAQEGGRNKIQEPFWLAQELQDSLTEYHSTVAGALEVLVGRKDESTELLTRSVQALDRHVVTMDALVSAVTSRFLLDK